MENFRFIPDFVLKDPEKRAPYSVDISIAGERGQSPEAMKVEFGKIIAEEIVRKIIETQSQGKKLVFDMATGSTPKAVWPELKSILASGNIDLSNVIVVGHEEAWGNYEPGSKSDFDAYRQNFLSENDAEVANITEPVPADQDIQGNFVPMHLISVDKNNFPATDEGYKAFIEAEAKAAEQSAKQYQTILNSLRKRSDTEFFGLYGVGTDGHVGEMQISSMGKAATLARRDSYSESLESYSIEAGLFYWQKDDGDFHPENNIFWQRGASVDEPVGRANWQGYTNIHTGVGIGWRDLLKEESLLLAFNDSGKSLALTLAIEGSFSGEISSDNSPSPKMIEANKGEGEAIYNDLAAMLDSMSQDGLLDRNILQKALDEGNKCNDLFNVAYQTLDNISAQSDNPYYAKIWELLNRYMGKRSPVGRLIKLRAILNRKTEIVATREALDATPYSDLV